jgi:hypothetical protein
MPHGAISVSLFRFDFVVSISAPHRRFYAHYRPRENEIPVGSASVSVT